jgi:hypothetical protein
MQSNMIYICLAIAHMVDIIKIKVITSIGFTIGGYDCFVTGPLHQHKKFFLEKYKNAKQMIHLFVFFIINFFKKVNILYSFFSLQLESTWWL